MPGGVENKDGDGNGIEDGNGDGDTRGCGK